MLKTLVITSDPQLVEHVEPALRRLEFQMDLKPTVTDGVDKMRYERYCAVLIDCAAGSLQQVDDSRKQWLKRDSTVNAIAGQGANTYEGISGADAVWTQPLMPWEIHRTLLSVRTQEIGDRRLRKRYTLPRPVPLRFSYDGEQFQEAAILDVTETGVAMEGADALSEGRVVHIQFKLPGMLGSVQSAADVVWRAGRRGGLRFVELPEPQRRQLERWLRQSRLGMSTGYSYAN